MNTTRDSLPIAQTAAAPSTEAERLQLITLVQQFEGMLLTEMLRDVRAGDDEDVDGTYGLGGTTMNDTLQSEFGLALSRAGGLGMGDMLVQALARQQSVTESGDAATSAAVVGDGHDRHDPARVPAGAPGGGLALPVAPVTSHFGWRNDPLSGRPRFHAGTDLLVAYGSEVRAAAPGVVVSAGDRPGYGLTVVVDHGGGRETRYAHLSGVEVGPGATVESGELIARSGNSGRTTGAHLHFEAREFGRPVDPGVASTSWNDRKSDMPAGTSVDADLRY